MVRRAGGSLSWDKYDMSTPKEIISKSSLSTSGSFSLLKGL